MANRMLEFTHRSREMPDKRPAAERVGDFHEIYKEFIEEKAQAQASRCSQCGVPFCSVHCPLHNNIPDWLMLTSQGRLQEAYDVAQETNTFPEVCGRICPQDRLCEGMCVIEQSGHGTVTIGAVEKYLTETAWEQGWVKPIEPGPARGQSVGIVGAGPAGLAAAERLRRLGYGVTVYDRYDRVGGLMIYGIPNFKLDKTVVERRTRWLHASGIRFVLNCDIGRDMAFEDVQAAHDAVLIATGVYAAREMAVPGAGLPGIYPALDFLTTANRVGLGDRPAHNAQGALNARDRRVIVVGGGDTAMDCVRTAVRQGAKSVTCLYRRDRINMPGSIREVAHAEEEGVQFRWLEMPRAALGEDRVEAMRVQPMRLGAPDASGRRVPEPCEREDLRLEADMVIKALGFEPEPLPDLFALPHLAVSRSETLRVDRPGMMTNLPGVFAAGDIVRGASLVVWAIREGRDAAAGIHAYLEAGQARKDPAAA
ncbi:MAG: NAD(P)-dependent oxidoreductase [Alphaproteobacteria bacterium]